MRRPRLGLGETRLAEPAPETAVRVLAPAGSVLLA
jgi:hypothetical protein